MAEDFTSEKYVDPSSATEGINGGKQFVGSDALFADDINKIVNNEMYLFDKIQDRQQRHHCKPEQLGRVYRRGIDFEVDRVSVFQANDIEFHYDEFQFIRSDKKQGQRGYSSTFFAAESISKRIYDRYSDRNAFIDVSDTART